MWSFGHLNLLDSHFQYSSFCSFKGTTWGSGCALHLLSGLIDLAQTYNRKKRKQRAQLLLFHSDITLCCGLEQPLSLWTLRRLLSCQLLFIFMSPLETRGPSYREVFTHPRSLRWGPWPRLNKLPYTSGWLIPSLVGTKCLSEWLSADWFPSTIHC